MRKWSLQIIRWTFLVSSLTWVIPATAYNQQNTNRLRKATPIGQRNKQERMHTGSSMISMDYARYLAPTDLHFTKPTLPIEGIPLGNGKMGSLVWVDQSGSSLQFNFGRPDVFYRGSATTTWTDSSHIDGNSKVGWVAINFAGSPFSNTCIQHLHTYDGYESLEGTGVSARIVPWRDHDVFAIEITDNRSFPAEISVDLKKIKPDTLQGLYSFKSIQLQNNNRLTLRQVISEKCNTGITENDFYCSSGCIVAVQGRKATVKDNRLMIPAGKGKFTIFIASSASIKSQEDVIAMASAEVNAALSSNFNTIFNANKNQWNDFWQKSFIYLPGSHDLTFENSFDQHWLYYLYCMNTCQRSNYPIHANGGIFNVRDGWQMWGSMYWWFNSSRQTLTPVFEQANHPELADPYFTMLSNQFPKINKAAIQQWGTGKDAVYIQETFPFDGPEILPENIANDLKNTLVLKKGQTENLTKFILSRSSWESRWSMVRRISGYHSHLLYNTAEAAQWYWERYEYTKDLSWLRDKAYPMIRGAAELYRTHPLTQKEADGKYHTNNLGWAETFWGGIRDGINDLASIRGIFPVAIKAAKLLNVDSQLIPLWQEMMDNLAPYPTNTTPEAVGALSKAGEPVYAIGIRPDTKGKGSDGSDHDPRMMMVNIFDMVNTESKLTHPEEWQMAMNTLEGLKVAKRVATNNYDGEPLSRFFGEMARMGSTEWVKKCFAVYRKYYNSTISKHPNHMRRYDTNEQSQIVDWQQEGTLCEGLSASLLQSGAESPGATPIIRIFPAWPKDEDASFTLRAKGDFIVTSMIKSGEVNFIEVTSNRGGSCTIRNYWGSQSVDLYRNNRKSETLTTDLLTFPTQSGENIVIVKNGTNPSDFRIKITPGIAVKNMTINDSPLAGEIRNLIPSTPGKSPNYWCTWSAQSYMYGQGAKEVDPIIYKVEAIPKYSSVYLNEEVLFGDKGWLKNFYNKIKGDLWVVLDDGWDIPANKDYGYRNYSRLDPAKFPSFRGSIPENLALLNKKVTECGWRGVGLWYRAYEPAVDSVRKKSFSSEIEYKNTFWSERLEWSKNAGIGYWKMDGGGNEAAYKMITSLADKKFPGLIMEHGNASKDGPFNSYPGSGIADSGYREAGKAMITYSEVMRLHDVSPQLGIPTMLDRMATILEAVKTHPPKTGYLNCEDEVYIAAVLGGTMGVMRTPMVGLRPGNDPDIYLKGPRNIKKRMDEVVRAVRWQRIAPAFGAGISDTHLNTQLLTDSYKFPSGEFWTSAEDWDASYKSVNKIVPQGAPASVTRGLPLPEVKCDEEPPYVLASRNPNGAISIGTYGRINSERGYHFPEADVSLKIGKITGKIGVFGHYKSLTLILDKPIRVSKIFAQDLAGDQAEDITSKVTQNGDQLVIPGMVIRQIGLSAATPGDLSDPGMVLDILESK